MQVRDIMEGIGSFLEWTFELLPILGNSFNWVIIIIGFALMLYWIREMIGHSRAGEH